MALGISWLVELSKNKPLNVYNSLSRKSEVFTPIHPPAVKMYCCGPTVYDLLHVGNFRGPVFYNLVRNWLEAIGYKVTFVYNYTDVDDKIIHRAQVEKVDSKVVSERYIEEFKKDYNSLGLRPHDRNPRVTEHMQDIIDLVKTLIEKNYAYVQNGDVLFSIQAFQEYGKLSGRKPDELIAGSRVEIDDKKRNPLDFALWKAAKPGEPSWESPWGAGRPGWHIECSAMVRALLGTESIDIHGGGSDLIFPHHENEIAQSECASGMPLAKYWMHNNMFTFSGQKMSKSLGNVWKARDFLAEYHPEVYKYMVLSVHYRSLAEFSEKTAQLAIQGLSRIYSSLALARQLMEEAVPGPSAFSVQVKENEEAHCLETWTAIVGSMNDDFSTSAVFAKIYEEVRRFNAGHKRGLRVTPEVYTRCFYFCEFFVELGKIFSLFQEAPVAFLRYLDDRLLVGRGLDRLVVDQLVAERSLARQNKDFMKSDELRAKLTAMGISVSDTPAGSFWEVDKQQSDKEEKEKETEKETEKLNP